ncbi:hypothetical protein PBT90_12405 [Algoriphagus halophytocola]|uniref:Uncharacterized protein n=1 Tax=Algoriphagus halophytocola TaxID=2991499 RepID=A0ABY6MK82_9BACT|nr:MULTISPECIES: hypothetical protein [unclassified Algoriphagus]UZD24186.1 hypothetical protein OM944_06730 [Algoriphagus sp. TR-M5]WBL41555.1 hypothetical protein PBT90_12405 [Algoriphagus sp. TR-M9]
MEKTNLFDSPIKILGGSILLVEGILAIVLAKGNLDASHKSWIIIGMLVALFLTIVSAVLMHWIDNRQSLPSVTKDTEYKTYEYDVFIAFPIAAIKSKVERAEINEFANNLETELKKIGYKRIFNASLHFSNNHEHQPPKVAAKTDLEAIEKSRNFLLIYPVKTPTSALIELGFAMGGQKNIIMCSVDIHTLPFLARGFSEAFRNVNYLEYSDNEHLINMLVENNEEYFKK